MYGRAGWCYSDVKPLFFDITAALHPLPAVGDTHRKRTRNSIVYRGLYQGRDPSPKQSPGAMVMSANLVLQLSAGTKSGDVAGML